MLTLPTGRAWSGLGLGVGTASRHCSAICRGNQRRLQLCMLTHMSVYVHVHVLRICLSYLVSAAAPAPAQQFLPFSSSSSTGVLIKHTHTRSTYGPASARSNEFQTPRGHMLCSLRDGESFAAPGSQLLLLLQPSGFCPG